MQREDQTNLFFYGHNTNLSKRYNSIAKSFIKTVIALCEKIEQNEDTESFKNEIMLVIAQEENKGIGRLELIKETKICIFEESLDDICEKLRFNEVINIEKLSQFKKNVVDVYINAFGYNNKINQIKFEGKIKSLVDRFLDNLNYHLDADMDIERATKYRKLEL